MRSTWHRRLSLSASLVLVAGALSALSAQTAHADTAATSLSPGACTALTSFQSPSIVGSEVLSAKVVEPEGGTAYCEVRGETTNKAGGVASFLIALPLSGYADRFYFRGCGGSCGMLTAPDQGWLARGSAYATTDMVKHSFGPLSFAWARNNREAEIDFAYRATHEATVLAKEIIDRAYGAEPKYSYFWGGSTGGRQALVEAQRYPEDYDGIVNLYPASNETQLGVLHLLWSALANMDANGDQILTNEDAETLHAEAMAYCDPIDGLVDGVIEDPRNCDWKASMSSLPPAKAAAAQKLYDGPTDSAGRRLIPGSPQVGSELNWRGNYIATPGSETSSYYQFGGSFTRDAAYRTDLPESWKPEQFDFDADHSALNFMEQLYTGTNTDMSRFKARGGKMLMFQGWADQSVVPGFNLHYYDRLVKAMGGRAQTDSFLRLFMVPNQGHANVPIDTIPVIEDWVERGIAPSQVLAEGIVGATVAPNRPLYPFPLVPRWSGVGDVNDPSTWRPHDPTKAGPPATAPGKVRALTVKGKPRDARRVVTWKAPARTGGSAILGYRVRVTQGSKVLRTAVLAGGKRRLALARKDLRKGQVAVTVVAVNASGASKPVTKRFRVR